MITAHKKSGLLSLLAIVLMVSQPGCNLLADLLSQLPGGSPIPQLPDIPPDSVLVLVQNDSGVAVSLEAVFNTNGQEVRRTSRLLAASGVESTEVILRTVADEVVVTARIAPDGATTKLPVGFVLHAGTYERGTDYDAGGILNVVINVPPPDCNNNGVDDPTDIASGTSSDCDADGIPDECVLKDLVVGSCPVSGGLALIEGCTISIADFRGQMVIAADCTRTVPVTIAQSPPPGTQIGPPGATVTLTASTPDGRTATCTLEIAVEDSAPPTIHTCPPPTSQPVGPSCPAVIPDLRSQLVASDNCTTQPALEITQSPEPGASYEDDAQITLTVTDSAGNESVCHTAIKAYYTTPTPTSCPADATIECGDSTDPELLGVFTATDDCDPEISISHSDEWYGDLECAGAGDLVRTWTAENTAGNSVTCVQTIHIVDTTPPLIECYPDAEVECGESIDPEYTGEPKVYDTCSEVSLDYYDDHGRGGTGQFTRVWTATDGCGLTATCNQLITIVDTTPPAVVSCGPIQIPTTQACEAQMPDVSEYVDASDICTGIASITQEPAIGTILGLGVHAVTVHVFDGEKIEAVCESTITVFSESGDNDEDGVPDECDNCTDYANPDQADCNGDQIGDACELNNCKGDLHCYDCNNNGVPDGCDFENGVVYVKRDAPDGGDGAGWATAMNSLQDALDLSECNDLISYIWVAAGSYTPDRGANYTLGNKSSSFTLRNGITILGGFAGNESNAGERNPLINISELSGDLAANDGPGFSNYTDNCYVVVTASNTDSSAILDGVTIRGGNNSFGGGIYSDSGSPRIINCHIRENMAYFGGGACFTAGAPQLIQCRFEDNLAQGVGIREGGGLMLLNCYAVKVDRCQFAGNVVNRIGKSTGPGGALRIVDSQTVVVNCLFNDNNADLGGAVSIAGSTSIVTVTNCTLTANSADVSGGAFHLSAGALHITNCILWNNTDAGGYTESAQVYVAGGTAYVNYSCVQGFAMLGGMGNTALNPMFLSASDFSLQGGSPCINTGNTAADIDMAVGGVQPLPAVDLSGNARIAGGECDPIVDMGCYESSACP